MDMRKTDLLKRNMAQQVLGQAQQAGFNVEDKLNKPQKSLEKYERVFNNNTETSAISNAPDAANNGRWIATLPEIDAAHTSTVTATDGINIDILNDVAWGDVLLCGGTYWLISQSDNQVSYHTQLSKEENPRGSPPVIRLRSRIALHLNPSPLYQ